MSLTPSCLFSLILIEFCTIAIHSLILPPPFVTPQALDEMRKAKKMDEFIKHLGIPDTNLCHPDTNEDMEPMFNADLPFGDLIMDEKEEEAEDEEEVEKGDIQDDFETGESPSGMKSGKSKKEPKKWPNGIVPYYISNDFTSEQRQKIEKAIAEMNSKISNVYFRRFRDTDRNYVIIFSGKGCYAKLGMEGGQQPVSLQANKCLKKGTIQHEMLHVLGFSHEQNRPDRDAYIDILYDNIPEKWWKNYKRFKFSSAVFLGKYDYYSCLHYPPQAPGSRGKKLAFSILNDSVNVKRIGSRKMLSEMDAQKADELYSEEAKDFDGK